LNSLIALSSEMGASNASAAALSGWKYRVTIISSTVFLVIVIYCASVPLEAMLTTLVEAAYS
jgi:hypothetical protein